MLGQGEGDLAWALKQLDDKYKFDLGASTAVETVACYINPLD